MKLSTLLAHNVETDVDIAGLTADSRAVKPGFLFAALKGVNSDGAQFIPQAEAAGAAAILCGEKVSANVPVFVVDEPRKSLAHMAARFYPRQPEFIAGITGTNGKTSTAQFASQLWQMLGIHAGALGTLGVQSGDEKGGEFHLPLNHTTPEPVTLHHALDTVADWGCTHLAMEVSSHGLAQFRADGVNFNVAAFTNITQDHLDYHPDFDDYFAAKQRLFVELLPKDATAILNADGEGAQSLETTLKDRPVKVVSTGQAGKDIEIKTVMASPDGLDLTVKAEGRIYSVSLPLVVAFQAENALLAAGIVIASGHSPAAVLPLLARLKGVNGRMMRAGTKNGAGIYVDYAHTPDAVETALSAARPHTKGRLIAIIGAGGDRDAGKRALMGKAAHLTADYVIITDDNPRTEDPEKIRSQIKAGAPDGEIIGDRAKAISTAIAMLSAGDVLMILGKGHETGQIVGNQVLPFDDAAEVAKCVETINGG